MILKKNNSETVPFLQQLIRAQSITPDDAGCMDIICQRLEPLGFTAEWIKRNGVSNLWIRKGTQKPLVCFAGHTDVVPTGPAEAWTSPPFEPVIRDGFLFGRGTTDMKGSIAAFVIATEAFVAKKPDFSGSIALLLTSDEEGVAIDGTAAVVDCLRDRNETIDFCIVGEPTAVEKLGDTIKNGRRGSLHGALRVQGKQGHIAYLHRADNPIHRFALAVAELDQMKWDDGNAHFPPTTWQISNIHAGTGADNVIPGYLDARFNFRFSTASTPESLRNQFEATVDKYGLKYSISWSLGAKPFLTEPGLLADTVMTAIVQETGIQPKLSTSGGTSDGRFISEICNQLIELGPVNATAHQIDECICIDSLNTLSAIYQRILYLLLA